MDEIQQVFEEARKYIEKQYKPLKLTLIELVRLKRYYVEPAIPRAKQFDLDAYMEAATFFLIDYYGIPANSARWVQSTPIAVQ